MIRIKALIVLAICSSLAFTGWSQQLSEGMVKMELIDVKTDNPQMSQMLDAMKGSTQVIYFNEEQQKVDMTMMGGMMHMQMYQDFNNNTSESYIDMMGQKIKTIQSSDEKAKQAEASKAMMGDSGVKYDKNDTKEILGYKCHKAMIEMVNQGQKATMTFYITPEIKVPKAFVQNMDHLKLEGAPLEINMDLGMMGMTYRAVEISKDLPADFFKKPEGDYKEMTTEQLQQMGMGQMGGF